jgi:hypothetical protein
MRLKWTNLIVAIMLALVMGLHWVVLQSFGWVQMFVSYAQTEPVREAFIKTFDGKHPCQVCKLVREGKRTESKQQLQKMKAKFDYWLGANEALLFPPLACRWLPITGASAAARVDIPPVPPPREA